LPTDVYPQDDGICAEQFESTWDAIDDCCLLIFDSGKEDSDDGYKMGVEQFSNDDLLDFAEMASDAIIETLIQRDKEHSEEMPKARLRAMPRIEIVQGNPKLGITRVTHRKHHRDYEWLMISWEFYAFDTPLMFLALAFDAWGLACNEVNRKTSAVNAVAVAEYLAEARTCAALATLEVTHRRSSLQLESWREQREQQAKVRQSERNRMNSLTGHKKNAPYIDALLGQFVTMRDCFRSINEAAEHLADSSKLSVVTIRRHLTRYVKAHPEHAPQRRNDD